LIDKKTLEEMVGSRVKSVAVYDKVDASTPHGVYIYDQGTGKWVYVEFEGEFFNPKRDGIYVIYFDNAKCPACRVYDIHWFPFVTLLGSTYRNTFFVIVLCEWFARNCSSQQASNTFKHYDIHASPTTLLLYVHNGVAVSSEKVEGVKTMDKLAKHIEEFAKKNRVEV